MWAWGLTLASTGVDDSENSLESTGPTFGYLPRGHPFMALCESRGIPAIRADNRLTCLGADPRDDSVRFAISEGILEGG